MTFNEDRPHDHSSPVVERIVELNHRLLDMFEDEQAIRHLQLILDPEPDMLTHESSAETAEQMIFRKINVLTKLRATLSGVDLEMYEYRDSQDKDRYWRIPRENGDLFVTERYYVTNSGTFTDVKAFLSTEEPRRYQDIRAMKQFRNNVLAAKPEEPASAPSKLRRLGRGLLAAVTTPLNQPPKRKTR